MDESDVKEQDGNSSSQIFDDQTSFTTNIIGKDICWDQINNVELNPANLTACTDKSSSITSNIISKLSMSNSIMNSFCVTPSKKGINKQQFGLNKRNLRSKNNKLDLEDAFNSLNQSTDVDELCIEAGKKLSYGFGKKKSSIIPSQNVKNNHDFSAAFNSSAESNDSLRLPIALNKKKISAFVKLKNKQFIKNQQNVIDFEDAFNSATDDSAVKSPKNEQQKLNSNEIENDHNMLKKRTSAFRKLKNCREKNNLDFQDAFESSDSSVHLSQDDKNKSKENNNSDSKNIGANSKSNDNLKDKSAQNDIDKTYLNDKQCVDNNIEDDNEGNKSNLNNHLSSNLSYIEKDDSKLGSKTMDLSSLPVKNKSFLVCEINKDNSKINQSDATASGLSQCKNSISLPTLESNHLSINISNPNLLSNLDQDQGKSGYNSLESSSESDDDDINNKDVDNLSNNGEQDDSKSLTEISMECSKSELNDSEVSTYRKSLRKSLKTSILNISNDKGIDNLSVKENSKIESSLQKSIGINYQNYNSIELTTSSIGEQSEYLLNNSNINNFQSNVENLPNHTSLPSYNIESSNKNISYNLEVTHDSTSSISVSIEKRRSIDNKSSNISRSISNKESSQLEDNKSSSKKRNSLNDKEESLKNNLNKPQNRNYEKNSSLSKKYSSSKRKSIDNNNVTSHNENSPSSINKNLSSSRVGSLRKRKSINYNDANNKSIISSPNLNDDFNNTKLSKNNLDISLSPSSGVSFKNPKRQSSRNGNNNKSLINKSKNNNQSKNETPNIDSNGSDIVSDRVPLSELHKRTKRLKVNDCNIINNLLSYNNKQKTSPSINNCNDDNENLNKDNDLDDLQLELKKTKRFKKPKEWVSRNLYDFIIVNLKEKYGFKSRLRAENFVIYLCDKVTTIQKLKLKNDYEKHVNELKLEMARLKIITTHYDFYIFVITYLPGNVFYKSVPTLQPFNLPPLVTEPPGSMLDNIL